MTRQGALALALAAALSACGGARKEARQPSGSARASERHRARQGEGEGGRGGEGDARASTQDRARAPRVPSSPGSLLGSDTISQLQQALAQRGLLAQHRQGELDEPTSVAVRQFQQKQGLAATGVPDKETLRKLGVSAEDGYGSDRGTGSRERNEGPR